ncbi:hypothetical protein SynA18461_00498 [Synechococcus sp. A18-46.1]|nr:hypothetical protein SynA18461_00498 [Synechococcus sp. A18-46.1]
MFKPFLLPIPNFLISFFYALIKALRLSPFYSFVSMFSRQPLDLVYHDNSLLEYINWDDSTDNFADLLHLTYS